MIFYFKIVTSYHTRIKKLYTPLFDIVPQLWKMAWSFYRHISKLTSGNFNHNKGTQNSNNFGRM